ncbi:transaldolase [Candidatus Vecturithrix granuli]|uniref:Transaldolase n=1 Tax=Vecturithrix granuli TaxID=1499967 RepID=A0A081C5R6_VECG1|nr:transaldolase [Candidatus Vecturithrix granuli]
MAHQNYLDWLVSHTQTTWWNDSGAPDELTFALEHGATGVTTNPVLSNIALRTNRAYWATQLQEVFAHNLAAEQKAEALTRIVVTHAASQYESIHKKSGKREGYVCAQVNPVLAGDREAMFAMAQRFHAFAPNIAVKLPVTAAGLEVLERCTAQGITVTATVSFCVPQVVQIAEAYRRGIARALGNGVEPGKCFAVIMIGRLDDYLRDVAKDSQADLSESDIQQAGLAVTKRAYKIYQERGYEAVLLIAALRGTHHVTELAGAKLILSIHPTYQKIFLSQDLPCEERIERDISADVIARLEKLPEFVRSYEPDGMMAEEFITYGANQRTLSQFIELGWKPLENFHKEDVLS